MEEEAIEIVKISLKSKMMKPCRSRHNKFENFSKVKFGHRLLPSNRDDTDPTLNG